MAIEWHNIQNKWQTAWQQAELGKATVKKNQEKFFMIFAYPGVSGYLHVGHMRGFSYTDAICRYERLNGKEVLFPVGTHASGNQAIAFANKVKNNDPSWIEYLKNNGCSDQQLKQLTTPENVISYFNQVYVNDYWKKFGFLCDWDRFTCTTNKDYEKFIQWQFQKLQQKDLLIQKPYFATACVNCGPVAVDPSETDISKGGNAEKTEYTLLKFKYNYNNDTSTYLIAATLRPETIYGQTNLWINPDAKYVRIQVDNEHWIVSQDCADKLKYQKDEILLKEDINPKTLVGKHTIAPGIDREIIILPATFCDPKIGTGIVTSVPSDAPYDYVALKHLQTHPEIATQYNLNPEDILAIQLIPIIKSKDYGDFPAKEIVEKLNITELSDPKLEQATAEIYKTGYHTGIMKEICGKYGNMTVEQAKELMKLELLEDKSADIFHDLSEEVICRCGNKVIIKRIDDQWFIRYSDPELTERSKEQAKEMHIFPQEYHDNLPKILDWFGDRACARLGNWLGSKLPFDDKWTIEPISDSTLYPAYYLISKFINNKIITTEDLTEEFFDYIFLDKTTTDKSNVKEKQLTTKFETWKQIQEEFQYFYPLDINLGGKEHKTVHFPVFLMNHVAIMPEEKWPQGIFVNWWVTGSGSKISKSKGGAEPIPQAIEKYGVDAMRLYYAHIGSPHIDVVWTEDTVLNYKNALERIYTLIESYTPILETSASPKSTASTSTLIDTWLISKLHQHLKQITQHMKNYDLRELTTIVYFSMYDDLRWYQRRQGSNPKILQQYLHNWSILMNPITPHISEEIHSKLNTKLAHLASTSSWPKFEEQKISHKADAQEQLILSTVGSMRNVLKLAKIETPKKFTLFITESWLYDLYLILSKELKVTHNMGEIIKKVLEHPQLAKHANDLAKIIQSIIKDPAKLPEMIITQQEELTAITDAKEFLEKEFSAKIEIILAENSDQPKAKSAAPGKIGIIVE